MELTEQQRARVEASAAEYLRYCTTGYSESLPWPDVVRSALTAADAPLRELIKKWRAVDALGNTYLRTGFMCADELEALVMPAPEKAEETT
jgi:hypothetical protein